MNFCGKCGNKLNEGARFCPKCGKQLNSQNHPNLVNQSIQNQNSNAKPFDSFSAQQYQNIPLAKKRSRKGLIVTFISLFLILFIVIAVLFSIKFNRSGEISLGKCEYKDVDTNLLIYTEHGKIPSNQILVMLDDAEGKSKANKLCEIVAGNVTGYIEFINLYQIETNPSSYDELLEKIRKIRKEKGVFAAFPNTELKIRQTAPSCDPMDDKVYDNNNYSKKDGNPAEQIGLKNAWKIIKASGVKLNGVHVGVLDEKIDFKYDKKIKNNKNVSVLRDEDAVKRGGGSHGNMIVDIIGGDETGGSGVGVAAVLKDNLKITATCPFKKNEALHYTDAIDRMKAQVESGAKIINCSIGYLNAYEDKDAERDDVKGVRKFLENLYKDHPDVTIVAAAPNDKNGLNGKNDWWGHKLPNLVTVSGVTGEGEMIGSYQGEGGEITVCGIDGYIYHGLDDPGGGTSGCAPEITGTIALLKSINPDLKCQEIKDVLTSTASNKVNGKDMPPNSGSGLVRIDDAVLKVINDMRKKQNKPPLKKEDLLQLADLKLSSSGGPKEFTLTAELKSVNEKGESLIIDFSNDNCSLKDEKQKTINTPGTISWKVILSDEKKPVTVNVKRLELDICKSIELGGEIKAEDLVGEWTGGVSYDNWSTSLNMVRKQIESKLVSKKGEFLSADFTFKLKSEKELYVDMKVSSGYPLPSVPFIFSEGQLVCKGYSYNMTSYNYTAEVTQKGGEYTLSGTWTSSAANGMLDMSGKWKGTLKK